MPEKRVAKKALRMVKGKVPVALKNSLKGVRTKNVKSAIENGRFMTDTIAGWVKKKFVAGPYEKAPMKEFRVNPLMAAVQKTKVRPIMHLSSPKGNHSMML